MNSQDWFIAQLVVSIAVLIPLVRGLLQLAEIKANLQAQIKALEARLEKSLLEQDRLILANAHRIDLLELKGKDLIDQQDLALNGLKEIAQHVRSRSQLAEEKLSQRLGDVERYLNKTTEFVIRS